MDGLLGMHGTVGGKYPKDGTGSSQASHGELSTQRPVGEWRKGPQQAAGEIDCQKGAAADFFMQGSSDWYEGQKAHVHREMEDLLVAKHAAQHAKG